MGLQEECLGQSGACHSHPPPHTHTTPPGSGLGPQHTPWLLRGSFPQTGTRRRGLLPGQRSLCKRQRGGMGSRHFGGQGGTALGRRGTGNVAAKGTIGIGRRRAVPFCSRVGSAACPSANFCPCQGQQCPWAQGARFACFPPWRGCHLILRKASTVPGARQFCLKEKVKVTPKKIPANLCKELGREAQRAPGDPLQGPWMPAQLSWWARSGSGCPRPPGQA